MTAAETAKEAIVRHRTRRGNGNKLWTLTGDRNNHIFGAYVFSCSCMWQVVKQIRNGHHHLHDAYNSKID